MEFSRIADTLYVGTTPRGADFDRLRSMGIRLIINMRFLQGRAPRGGSESIHYLRLRTFDSPLLPIPIRALNDGTRAALEVIAQGGGVYVHCSRGRHRSVAMAAAILIAQGTPPGVAMQLIQDRRPIADPQAPHIRPRILAFARQWRREHASISNSAAGRLS